MTTARPFYEQQPELSVLPQKDWPTMYDLPSEDPEESGLPDEFHNLQPQLLSATLRLTAVAKDQIFTGTDLNLYYDLDHPTWYKRPDWFVVTGVPRLYAGQDLRLSYVIWDEQVSPAVVVELISPGTAMSDLGELQREPNGTPTKWQVYEEILQVPYYVIFDRYQDRLWVFKLVDGQYQAQDMRNFRYWLADLGIGLGVWQGAFEGITRSWLRWYDTDGEWILTETEYERQRADQELEQRLAAEERAKIAALRAEDERQQRLQADQRAEQLAERLRKLGIDPNDL
ncbi:MAG: Uma2 family endonuclease [Acaryochloris sp. RU_4_1]|nr:Uma2 family endonuclease [Acaryochloris sp. SU_5_25]NJM66291.1 Uma2 family endonuclease [Acaryochloris sp. RU_4_1]NJN38433.1 Uma2 family endonuclease [Acaryochloridaceae cyanobacterium CSU_3_4]NJR56227.1 Uma2 family endonuclease [Acaryochloris sp. CRU_2_0]